MITIPVEASRAYDIHIGKGLLESVGTRVKALLPQARTVAIITDKNVEKLYGQTVREAFSQAGFGVISHAVPPGEKSKSLIQFFELNCWLAENRVTRSDVVIALGGGVVGDLAGFVASTYLRGVQFVQMPTTLLAMVDSSVGGKTGIDIPQGKNLVGAFYQPCAVLCDTATLDTLSPETYADGCAEMVKHGMIRSVELIEMLQVENGGMAEIIAANATIKRDIVQQDEYDTGARQLLNFGHTIGHAIEKLSNFAVHHGAGVAIGMSIITRAAVRKKLCPANCLSVLQELLAKFNLPSETDFSPAELYEAALTDKKRMGDTLTEVLPSALGNCVLHRMRVSDLLSFIEMGYKP